MSSGRPRWARWVTRVSLVAALVALVYTIHHTGLRTIGSYFRRIGWWWFAVAALEIVITTLDALAMRAFMSPEQDKVQLRQTLLAQLAGRAVNAVTPGGNLGEAIKISVLTEHVSQSRAVSTILLYNVASFSVELAVVAIAAPIMAVLVPMPDGVRYLMLATGGICLILSVGLYALVRRGMLVTLWRGSFARFIQRMRLVFASRQAKADPTWRAAREAQHAKWEDRLRSVDDKVRLVAGARRRDRWLGIAAVTASRLTSMGLSFMILHAVGESVTLPFVAGYTVGSFGIYMLSSLVPMGLGISEGGTHKLFQALGENPARGVTLVLARRVTLIMYAAIGVVLVTASETVKRAKARSKEAAMVVVSRDSLPTATIVSLPPVADVSPAE